jgi:Fe-S cluster assembly iron-binding protein IscA
VEDWGAEQLRCVIDPKSLLFLFGMQLDYRCLVCKREEY